MWETRVQPLGQDRLLEKEMAPHSSTLAWRIPWTEEPGGLQSVGLQRVGHEWATSRDSQVCLESLCASLPSDPSKISEAQSYLSMDRASFQFQFSPLLLFPFYLFLRMAQMFKNLPTMQETWVWTLGQEDPLEKEMATHSNILAWEILTEEPSGLQPTIHSQESDKTKQLNKITIARKIE